MTNLPHFAQIAFAMAGAALWLCGKGLVKIQFPSAKVKEVRA